ncbi:uncharacterized protein [Antedon mediterranea]|uniref:uncharacterized protein n=1 Tax=Antedon mediterranea TaxID=105859 RepID=UPI003AF4958A
MIHVYKHKKCAALNDSELTKKMRENALAKRVDNELKKDFVRSKTRSVDSESIPNEITSIWDYAGQLDYYITHRFFLTNTVSYCVAFSALDKLDELAKRRDPALGPLGMTNLDIILFWVRSVYEHTVVQHASGNTISIDGKVIKSPPISLVATHIDKLPGTKSEKLKEVQNMYKTIFATMERMEYAEHVDREMYMVNNTVKKHEGIEKLKRNVVRYMDVIGTKVIPLKWLDFQDRLQAIGKTRLCISFNEASRICNDCGIAEEAIIVAIRYMNDIGKIMYSNKDEKLRNTVITNLHTMIQMLTTVITVFPPHIEDVSRQIIIIIIKKMKTLWKRLDEEGILEEKLLRYLWTTQTQDHFEIFIEVMRVFRLLYEKKSVQEGNREFLVPCRMKVYTNTSLEVTKDDMQMVSIYLTPTDFLPEAVYHTLVVAFLELMTGTDSDDSQVFRNRSDFEFKDHKVSLGAVQIKRENEKPHAIKLQIYRRKEQSYDTEVGGAKPKKRKLQPSVCMKVIIIMHAINTSKQNVM